MFSAFLICGVRFSDREAGFSSERSVRRTSGVLRGHSVTRMRAARRADRSGGAAAEGFRRRLIWTVRAGGERFFRWGCFVAARIRCRRVSAGRFRRGGTGVEGSSMGLLWAVRVRCRGAFRNWRACVGYFSAFRKPGARRRRSRSCRNARSPRGGAHTEHRGVVEVGVDAETCRAAGGGEGRDAPQELLRDAAPERLPGHGQAVHHDVGAGQARCPGGARRPVRRRNPRLHRRDDARRFAQYAAAAAADVARDVLGGG